MAKRKHYLVLYYEVYSMDLITRPLDLNTNPNGPAYCRMGFCHRINCQEFRIWYLAETSNISFKNFYGKYEAFLVYSLNSATSCMPCRLMNTWATWIRLWNFTRKQCAYYYFFLWKHLPLFWSLPFLWQIQTVIGLGATLICWRTGKTFQGLKGWPFWRARTSNAPRDSCI